MIEQSKFVELLEQQNLHTALSYLNTRTPHRFTAIYKFNQNVLESVCLVDKYDTKVTTGENVLISNSYCSTLPSLRVIDMLTHIPDDYPRIISSVEAYGGVLITDDGGNPFGSLCHFDYKRCEVNKNDFALLNQAAPLIYKHLRNQEPDV